MHSGKCLFSAPFSFITGLRQTYNSVIATEFREIWKREELVADPDLTAWVMNPGQNFMVDDAALDLFPNVQVLSTPSTGSNHIDRAACQRRGVAVYSLLDDRPRLDSITASAEFTFLLALNALRRLDFAVGEVAEGRWRAREDAMRGHELDGKSVGLVGFGRIGRRMKRYCEAFGARVAFSDPHVQIPGEASVDLESIFLQSDLVVICCVLTSETQGLINGQLLRRLKPGATFVNTSRGEVVVEADLAQVVIERPDLRVALDVIAGEVTGTQYNSPLIELHRQGKIVISPHIAGATVESQSKAAYAALALLQKHLCAKAGH